MSRGQEGLEIAVKALIVKSLNVEKCLHSTSISGLNLDLLNSTPKQCVSWKPKGFWYGINYSWVEWCLYNQSDWLTPFIYELELGESILKITDDVEFGLFEEEYLTIPEGNISYIDYPKLINEGYNGLQISPYRPDKRFSFWYYGWDCASGCIWNIKGIKSIKLFAEYKNDSFVCI